MLIPQTTFSFLQFPHPDTLCVLLHHAVLSPSSARSSEMETSGSLFHFGSRSGSSFSLHVHKPVCVSVLA